jgi:hypothetical protein
VSSVLQGNRFPDARVQAPRLAAHALADGTFSPIVAWLSGQAPCSPADLAAALYTTSRATLASMIVVPDGQQ